jgi:hypothetical protein
MMTASFAIAAKSASIGTGLARCSMIAPAFDIACVLPAGKPKAIFDDFKKSGCGADVENGLPRDWIIADVLVELPPNVPYTGDGLAVGKIHRVIDTGIPTGPASGFRSGRNRCPT